MAKKGAARKKKGAKKGGPKQPKTPKAPKPKDEST